MPKDDEVDDGSGGSAADDQDWSADESFLAELRATGPYDQVPDDMMAAARAAFVWRTLDDDLAQLTYDSVSDDHHLAGVRGTESARVLTFESPALTLEVEASAAGPVRRLLGRLVPAQRGEVEVRHPGGSITVEADERGWFSADDVAPGPVSLRCHGTGPTVTTDWVLV